MIKLKLPDILQVRSHAKCALSIAVALLLIWANSCKTDVAVQTSPATLDFDQIPFKQLSEYGLFKGEMKALQASERLVLYEPIAPLFTDYAFKMRFMWMPEGSSATFDASKPDEALNFPDKTILVKNFYYPADFAKPEAARRIIETRLLIKHKGVWNAYPYRWNDAQTDADYKITGEKIPVTWKDLQGETHHIDYAMPNKNQCKSCHNQQDVFVPIGPKVKQLNHTIQYPDGSTQNQLSYLNKMGYLASTDGADKIKALVDYRDAHAGLDERARSYLDANCGHCHSYNGPASTSGMYLNFEEESADHLGVFKSPVAAGIGAGTFIYDIYPGKGKESIFTYRMNSTNPGIMMPEIGRVTIHKEGVELIEAWIDAMGAK